MNDLVYYDYDKHIFVMDNMTWDELLVAIYNYGQVMCGEYTCVGFAYINYPSEPSKAIMAIDKYDQRVWLTEDGKVYYAKEQNK